MNFINFSNEEINYNIHIGNNRNSSKKTPKKQNKKKSLYEALTNGFPKQNTIQYTKTSVRQSNEETGITE